MTDGVLQYLSGFGNEFESEALAGALPRGQFNPQSVPLGLYTEQLSSTAFTAPRQYNRRTWLYRIRPSVVQGEFEPIAQSSILGSPLASPIHPGQLRWDPLPPPAPDTDFIDGLVTFAANGNANQLCGMAIHLYHCNQSMIDKYFYSADGELLLVPQRGRLGIRTECGAMHVAAGEIALIPRGMKFAIDLLDESAAGYVCENYGAPLDLPERGPVGANGFANDRDFLHPSAAFEDIDRPMQLIVKFGNQLFRSSLDHSPLDVVAWTGNSVPFKYDLAKFNVINTVSYDHPDPSIFTVLTSQTQTPGVANVDFVIFPPRWMVAEHTFRPPWFHRNVMSEFMGLITGTYDARREGFLPGGASLHNCLTPHGPDAEVYEKATASSLAPERYENTLAFMFESCFMIQPTTFALTTPIRQLDYPKTWQGLTRRFNFEP